MKLIYNNKEVELKYGVREMLLFQEVTHGRVFKGESMTDCFYLFWCMLQVAYGDAITFEDVSRYLDDNVQIFADYMTWLASIFEKYEEFGPNKK